MGPIGVWGPHGIKGWWTSLGPAAPPSPKGPIREAQEGRGPATKTLTLGLAWGQASPPCAGPRRRWGHTPLGLLYKEGQGEGCGTPLAPPKPPPPSTIAAPPPPPLSPTPPGEALSDLHHTHHATVVVLLISRASPSTLAGSRTWSLHRAIRVDLSEVLLVRRLDNTSPHD